MDEADQISASYERRLKVARETNPAMLEAIEREYKDALEKYFAKLFNRQHESARLS